MRKKYAVLTLLMAMVPALLASCKSDGEQGTATATQESSAGSGYNGKDQLKITDKPITVTLFYAFGGNGAPKGEQFIAGSDYEHVVFAYQELPELGPGVANVFLHARMVSGASARLSFCPAEGLIMERASVSLLNTTYFVELPVWHSVDWPGRIRRFTGGREEQEIRGDALGPADDMSVSNGFYQENESFLLALATGRKPEGEVVSALQSVEIADCIRKRRSEYRRQG